jgi:hypothetical protein
MFGGAGVFGFYALGALTATAIVALATAFAGGQPSTVAMSTGTWNRCSISLASTPSWCAVATAAA